MERLCSQTGRLNIAKVAIVPKLIYRVNAILPKFKLPFF